MSGHVVLVVGTLRHPHVGDSEVHSRVGVGKDGNPLARVDRARVVEIGGDEDLLLAQLLPEVEDVAGELTGKTPRSGLEIGTDVQDHVRVLGDVVHHVVGREDQAVLAVPPDVLGAPEPTLPGVGITDGLGETAGESSRSIMTAWAPWTVLVSPWPSPWARTPQGPYLLGTALDLAGDDGGRLVPTDPHVLALAAVLRIALPVRIPVHPFERVQDAVGRVDPFLVGDLIRGQRGPSAASCT